MGKQKILDDVQDAISNMPEGTPLPKRAAIIVAKIQKNHVIISRECFKALNDKSMEWG